jgi:hypothetical protein
LGIGRSIPFVAERQVGLGQVRSGQALFDWKEVIPVRDPPPDAVGQLAADLVQQLVTGKGALLQEPVDLPVQETAVLLREILGRQDYDRNRPPLLVPAQLGHELEASSSGIIRSSKIRSGRSCLMR